MPQLARSLPMEGSLVARLVPRHGFYTARLPDGGAGARTFPSTMPRRARLRSMVKELGLRCRLFVHGAIAGAQGRGIVGVGRLFATVIRADGHIDHLGLISTRKVTTAGVAFLVDDWDGSVTDITTLKYHGVGTGATAEANTDTALVTESTTALLVDSVRATGTVSQPSANIMQSVATVTFDASAAITEHGIFSQAATGGGTLWDRSVFSAINVVSGDSIQFTYALTVSAEA